MLLKKETKDPRLQMVSITDVLSSRDLSSAKVFYTVPEDQQNIVAPLLYNKRLTFCKAALELNPVSLSSRIMPLMSLPFALRLDTSQI
jgi:hypothetical protein